MRRCRVRASDRFFPAPRGILGAALLATVLALTGCAGPRAVSSAAPSTAAPPLRVGIAPDFPPLAFRQNGAPAGVEVDFARHLDAALGVKTELVVTPWDDLIPALRQHRIDVIMSGMSITAARKQQVLFTHPYLRVGQMLLLRRADAARFRDAKMIDQPTTRVGFVSDTTGAAYAREHLSRARASGFDSVDAAAAALRAQQIDVFIADAPSIYALTATSADPQHELLGRYEPLTEEYLAWAVRLDDTALQARLNTVLTAWNADGTLDRVLATWIHVRRQPRPTK